MPDDKEPSISAEAENNTPEAPPARPVPLLEREGADMGCVALIMAGFIGVFLLPAAFLLGGAPIIIPLISLLLVAVITPLINPTEKMSSKARWVGRLTTFLVLGLGLAFAAFRVFNGETPLLRE